MGNTYDLNIWGAEAGAWQVVHSGTLSLPDGRDSLNCPVAASLNLNMCDCPSRAHPSISPLLFLLHSSLMVF